MNITLQRIRVKGENTEGRLRIDGLTICDTLENTHSCLPAGHYRAHLHKCRQYARKMILITSSDNKPSDINPQHSTLNPQHSASAPCSACKRKHLINNNTVMPLFCPMLKPGNGIHNRHDGSILVGQHYCLGLLIRPREVFDPLYARIRMAIKRGHDVTINITYARNNCSSPLNQAI